ncbi:phage terminase large subunit family protein [Microbulbifer spongiae]|uniref:phage terminase large subunit family protein n=1 Tax=Microbulbifer spongiae TaxID=2944933 RepID=UPI00345F1599
MTLPSELLAVTRSNLQRLVREIRTTWIPLPETPLIGWLPKNIKLPSEDSDNAGYYRVEYVPYFWGVMHALDSPVSWMVVMQKAAQIGWTVLLAADICKCAAVDPARILMLFPKDEKGRLFMDEKLVPIIEGSPAVSRVIDISTSRKGGSRSTRKKFPGGEVRTVGSNSISNVKSTTARRGYVEEPDDTNKDVGDQGDAIRHLRERLKRMRNKKLIIGGTPAVADLSQVEHYVRLGTMRVLPVTCHDCGECHVLDWENVSWLEKEGVPRTRYSACISRKPLCIPARNAAVPGTTTAARPISCRPVTLRARGAMPLPAGLRPNAARGLSRMRLNP